jgi:hypothetical protein
MFPPPPDGAGETAIPPELAAALDAPIVEAVGLEGRRLWLERRSCLGLDDHHVLLAAPAADVVRGDPELPPLWARHGAQMIVAANGHSTLRPAADWIPPLLERLGSGRAIELAQLTGEERALVLELVAMRGLEVLR